MTSQQIADSALAIYQSNPRETAESLLDEFFGVSEFKRQQRCVEVEFPCVITNSPIIVTFVGSFLIGCLI